MWEQVEMLARRFQAISVGTRIKILCLLKQQALCVGAITARLGITQGAVSQHLRILREAGLIEASRRGCHIHYRQREGALLSVRDALEKVLRCDQHKSTGPTELPARRIQVDGQAGKRPTPQPHPCRVGKAQKCHGARKHSCNSKTSKK